MKKQHNICPKCGSSEVSEFMYGLPVDSVLEVTTDEIEAQKRKRGILPIIHAGCVVESDEHGRTPDRMCESCECKWESWSGEILTIPDED